MAAIQATDVCLIAVVPVHGSADFLQVVITTYQTLNTDFVIPSDVESDEEREWLIDNGFVHLTKFIMLRVINRYVNFSGLLARAKWFRVILDEAQFIRNRSATPVAFSFEFQALIGSIHRRNTRSSRSVAYLRATYRWMLTGTPVTNTL